MIIDQRLINELRENTQKRKFFDKCENTFSIDKKSEFQSFNPSPYSQGKTGCCWLLSALMCISLFIEHSYGIKLNENTAFSKTYLMFYDKLERATLFIKEYSENLNNNKYTRYMLNYLVTDRGQWHMAKNLILKYGLVPRMEMDDNTDMLSTRIVNEMINVLLKKFAYKISGSEKITYKEIEKLKKKTLQNVYDILVDFFGLTPIQIKLPKELSREDKFVSPQEFFLNYINFPFDDYQSICNYGENLYTLYHIPINNNMINGEETSFLNLPDDEFFEAIQKQLNKYHFCWYTCDASKGYDINNSLFSCESLKNHILNSVLMDCNKSDMLKFKFAGPSHAMTFMDVYETDINRYFVSHNSKSDLKKGGYCYSTVSWVRKFVFQAIVHKSILSTDLNKVKKEVVKPWDFYHLA